MGLAHTNQLGETVDRKGTRLHQRGQLVDEPLLRPTLHHRCRFAAGPANPPEHGLLIVRRGRGSLVSRHVVYESRVSAAAQRSL
jgi:hypothetical protein